MSLLGIVLFIVGVALGLVARHVYALRKKDAAENEAKEILRLGREEAEKYRQEAAVASRAELLAAREHNWKTTSRTSGTN